MKLIADSECRYCGARSELFVHPRDGETTCAECGRVQSQAPSGERTARLLSMVDGRIVETPLEPSPQLPTPPPTPAPPHWGRAHWSWTSCARWSG